MPLELDRRALFQLSLLLLAVPIQLFISTLSPSTEEKRLESLQTFWSSIRNYNLNIKSSWTYQVCIDGFTRLASQLGKKIFGDSFVFGGTEFPGDTTGGAADDGESPALEVLKQKKYSWSDKGYFGSSPTPRYPRPSSVKFRIGQVVKHKLWGYRGIIIGWDATASAPPNWLKENHEDHPNWREQPNYAVLVDIRDRTIPQLTYVPEENIEVMTNRRVTHPGLEDYFEGFDGAQYLPRPWLKTIYPMDN